MLICHTELNVNLKHINTLLAADVQVFSFTVVNSTRHLYSLFLWPACKACFSVLFSCFHHSWIRKCVHMENPSHHCLPQDTYLVRNTLIMPTMLTSTKCGIQQRMGPRCQATALMDQTKESGSNALAAPGVIKHIHGRPKCLTWQGWIKRWHAQIVRVPEVDSANAGVSPRIPGNLDNPALYIYTAATAGRSLHLSSAIPCRQMLFIKTPVDPLLP